MSTVLGSGADGFSLRFNKGEHETQQPDVPSSSSPPWHNPDAWKRVKSGMSKSQVVSILGSPTSSKSIGSGVDAMMKLYYRGEVPGSGFVSGNVSIHDDRVYGIDAPVF